MLPIMEEHPGWVYLEREATPPAGFRCKPWGLAWRRWFRTWPCIRILGELVTGPHLLEQVGLKGFLGLSGEGWLPSGAVL